MNFNLILFSFLWLALCVSAEEPAFKGIPTDHLPLWEAGVLGGGGYSPDYPASDQNHWRWIGAPYFIYRGSIFRADREGARANLFRVGAMKLEFSAAGSFPARSRDNQAREGMPDLDWLGEVGPRLSLPLWRAWGYTPLKLYVPLRAVFSTDFSNFRHRGYTLTPKISLRLDDVGRPGWIGLATLTANFGDRVLNAYFYDVEPLYARAERPPYNARAGYMGVDLFAGVVIPVNSTVRLFFALQGNDHDGSANSASPLFKKRLTGGGFFGIGWTFYESKKAAVFSD